MNERHLVLKDRLKETRQQLGMSANDVAKALGYTRSRYSNWEYGIRKPQINEIENVANTLGVNPAYLVGWMKSPNEAAYKPINRTTVKGKSGSVVIPTANDTTAYNEKHLAKRQLDPANLISITVEDDAMRDVVCKGDNVLIDMSRKRSQVRDLFAILVHDRVWIRWIRPELDGKTYTLSAEDSSQYPDDTLTAEQMKALDIIGRVARIERDR